MRELIHRPPRAPSKCRHFLVVELQPFSLRKDTKIENFGGKMTHVPPQTSSFLTYFLHSSGFFSPWEHVQNFGKKSLLFFLGLNHTRWKDVNLKKTTIILPFFVPPGDESSLVTELWIRSLLLVEEFVFLKNLKCESTKSTNFPQFLDYSCRNLRRPP